MQKTNTEEDAIVLDYLKHGYAMSSTPSFSKSAIAQALGISHLTLLELVPKNDVFLQPQQEVYIGDGKRDEIHHIKGRIPHERLSETAKAELEHAVNKIVSKDETKYVTFFNNAQPLSLRMHQLELLPGLGKKHMWEILNARKVKPFESFEDIKNRVPLLPNPKQIVVKRILLEIKGDQKYKIFVS